MQEELTLEKLQPSPAPTPYTQSEAGVAIELLYPIPYTITPSLPSTPPKTDLSVADESTARARPKKAITDPGSRLTQHEVNSPLLDAHRASLRLEGNCAFPSCFFNEKTGLKQA